MTCRLSGPIGSTTAGRRRRRRRPAPARSGSAAPRAGRGVPAVLRGAGLDVAEVERSGREGPGRPDRGEHHGRHDEGRRCRARPAASSRGRRAPISTNSTVTSCRRRKSRGLCRWSRGTCHSEGWSSRSPGIAGRHPRPLANVIASSSPCRGETSPRRAGSSAELPRGPAPCSGNSSQGAEHVAGREVRGTARPSTSSLALGQEDRSAGSVEVAQQAHDVLARRGRPSASRRRWCSRW